VISAFVQFHGWWWSLLKSISLPIHSWKVSENWLIFIGHRNTVCGIFLMTAFAKYIKYLWWINLSATFKCTSQYTKVADLIVNYLNFLGSQCKTSGSCFSDAVNCTIQHMTCYFETDRMLLRYRRLSCWQKGSLGSLPPEKRAFVGSCPIYVTLGWTESHRAKRSS